MFNRFKAFSNMENMMYRKRGCHDCVFREVCADPNAAPDSDYCCRDWDWRYA